MKNNKLLKWILLGILGILGTGMVLLLTCRHGSGISPDSVAYISAARSLAAGRGFITYDGAYLVYQPPLYPIMLALIKMTLSIDPMISAGYINALLFGLIVFLSGLFFLKHLKSFTLVFLGTVSVLISYALVQASLMTLSESLFIFLLLLFLHFIEAYQNQGDINSLILFSVPAALACLTRYTGIIMILTGLISIIGWGKNTLKEKIKHSLIFLFTTCIPIGIWCIRNYYISGTFVGQRAVSSFTLVENLKFFLNTILPWYLPVNLTVYYLVFILLLVITWMLKELNLRTKSGREGIKLIGPGLIFLVFYSAIIVISSTTTAYDHISNRLLSPIYIPIIYILFVIADKIHYWLAKYFPHILVTVLFGIGIILMMRYPVKNTRYIIEEFMDRSGQEYSSNAWRNSETIQYIVQRKQLEKEYVFYSNAPEAVYILANIKSRFSPAKTFYNSPQLIYSNPKQKDIWQNDEKVCLVWFDKINRNFLFTIDELQKDRKMNTLAHLNDGKIYIFSGK
jgi:hypothetical protein